ncbi:MAG: DUF1385 domain-containing protein [Anaerolineae bacterium]
MPENAAPQQFNYGGQAVIEGVMMRGAHIAAIAVRDPKGNIVIREQPLNATLYRGRIAKTPFLRGLVGLWDALGLGTRALLWAADIAIEEEPNQAKADDSAPAKGAGGTINPHPLEAIPEGGSTIIELNPEDKRNSIFNGPLGWGTLIVSLALGVGFFFLVPTTAASLIQQALGLHDKPFFVNLIEGVIQISLITGYMWLIGRLPDVKRLFGYHGAEHKTINAYEAGAELTPEVVAQYPIEHPRCGTAFLLTVAFIGVLVFSILGRPPFLLLILSRVLLIPVIAGIAYEVIRFTAKNLDNPLVRIIIIPNLALQHLTTRPPDNTMLEVAIAAFKRVLAAEQRASGVASEGVVAPFPEPVSGD